MCIIRSAARRSPRVVAKVTRARFSIGVAISSLSLQNVKKKKTERKREREREREMSFGKRPRWLPRIRTHEKTSEKPCNAHLRKIIQNNDDDDNEEKEKEEDNETISKEKCSW